MCCFHLHFSDFKVFFFQKNKKTCCSLLLKKIFCCEKERKNNLSRGKIPAPLDFKWSVPYFYLPTKCFNIICVGEIIISEHGSYISALEHINLLILSSYLLACTCINKIINMVVFKRFSEMYIKFQILG